LQREATGERDRLPVDVAGARGAVWRHFRSDRLATTALVVLVAIVALCFAGEPLLAHLLGHGPDTIFPSGSDVNHKPVGPFSWIANEPLSPTAHHGKTLLVFGGDGPLGRDELLRLLAGGQVSLEIAVGGTVIALFLGVLFGTLAGYYGGLVDAVVGRLTELVMAFPLLLLVIAIGQTAADRFDYVTLHGLLKPGVFSLSVVLGLFSWFYPARVVRALVQTLREQEFVEAAQMTGAGDFRIIRRHLLPHLSGPLAVWGTLVGAGLIVLEAALSVLNFGIHLPTASWGNLLSSSWGTLLTYDFNNPQTSSGYPQSDWVMFFPAAALFVTVLCLVLVGDGVRSALDPRRNA
jgi:peptide/nickel transport system permease protein